jgi:hypothetical protein
MYIFIFILLFLAILSPPLMLFMLLGFFLMLPFLLLFHSIQTLVLVPVSLWQTFTNQRVRRNHALEHATANVLEERYGIRNVAGMAFRDGFALYGVQLHPAELMAAAREALLRLQSGETRLALHPRCGTSLLVGQFLFALVFLTIFLFISHFSMLEVLLLFVLSVLLAKPLGLLAQRYLTTSTDVDEMEFYEVDMNGWGQCFIRTAPKAAVYRSPLFWRFRSPDLPLKIMNKQFFNP